MQEFTYLIKDAEGLHARPAGILAKLAARQACDVTLTYKDKTVPAKRLFSIMGLAVKCGQEVTVRCQGDYEEAACAELRAFFEENL